MNEMLTRTEILRALVVVAIGTALLFAVSYIGKPILSNFTGLNSNQAPHIQPPPFTGEISMALETSKGFQVLVSYTDRGFEPSTALVKKGETVRFTNNSSDDLWVSAIGATSGKIYPSGGGDECGQSAFDSCRTIGRGEFWEFTFDLSGAWSYQNNADTDQVGVVVVH